MPCQPFKTRPLININSIPDDKKDSTRDLFRALLQIKETLTQAAGTRRPDNGNKEILDATRKLAVTLGKVYFLFFPAKNGTFKLYYMYMWM